ncbi:uncharacterized protein LOC128558985 isoform X1 [Mercenaria mercenaria]|uniref:uncharacterized protein LOC128558985 isoform X1 n=1 Tax=Mercenaria mercenaria TaxID=6596 RepID=UPI00234F71F9|nr:uncharacterized protein LOC128558985 isoform X1 [Mercenaria mercenaria]XP_053405569.1 uncharacterized protein LOC128558985 isoform X1 [Mercenaria mercenaria]XP_053405570.1 uncharacterized protein LOC128558985 isoform X1 [Mercenaria mercenaria]
MSALPQQQEGNLYDVNDVYVRPRMTIESKEEINKKQEVADVLAMSDIFNKDGKRIRSIYVLGEAGSGKSSFCKSLVHYWCLAHSDEGQSIEDEFSGVKEMKKFKFLFYLPLRHYTDKTKIKEMLEEKYEHTALKKLLECESRNCLVVLDGLDEWSPPASKCPPERGSLKEYTVLTTSRPWKIATLGISDNEIRQKIVLKGFDDKTSLKGLIEKTVPILNKTFEKDRVSSDCEKALENKSVASLKNTAIMLQQFICLWFDDKLRTDTSRCALYTEMLELFFDWHKKKHPDDHLFTELMKKSEDLKHVELPRYLIDSEVCKSYIYIIHEVSRLAYETLFYNTKETSLSFDISTFELLKISKEVKSCCLKLGILSEDKCLSFSASRIRRSIITFVHKSLQEYLAAVYIAIRFEEHITPSADSVNTDLSGHCGQLIKDVFSKCTTLDEILEQENVLVMLCGLEPQIALSVSKYIYDIVTTDKRVLQHRRTIDNESRHTYLISTVQKCIFNCIEEMQACIQSNLNLGDIILQSTSDCERLCNIFERQFISPDSVVEFIIDSYKTNEYRNRVINYLSKFQRLEAIHIRTFDEINNENIKSICDAIEGNTSSLKALSVYCSFDSNLKHICRTIVRRLPDMSHLVALKMDTRMPHKDVISLCTFLSGSSHLEQIAIDIRCEPGTYMFHPHRHEVDLFKHQQLQYLQLNEYVTVTRVNTLNLEIFECLSLESTNCVKVFNNLSTANKLTELHLHNDRNCTYRDPPYHTVTDKLITLLPLLHQLRELTLRHFTFTDNIMKFPSEMKSMEVIALSGVKMSLIIWRQFVDSLPLIPLPVKVKTRRMYIPRDGEECNPDTTLSIRGGEGEEAAARQYVREQEALFNVEYEMDDSFEFSTRQ